MAAFADRMGELEGSATGRAASVAGPAPDLDLGVGCPDWPAPAAALAGAVAALGGSMAYGLPGGSVELRERLTRRSPWHANSPARALELASVLTCGGKEAVFLGLGAVVSPGDRVVICAPYWPSFPEQVRAWGGVPVIVPAEGDLLPQRAALLESIVGAKALIVNSPGNPSGRIWPRKLFEDVAEALRRSDGWMLLDGVYAGLCPPGLDALDGPLPAGLEARALVVDSASKTFALPGLRIGWATGPAAWIDAIRKLQDATSTHPSIVAQRALSGALDDEATWLPGVRAQLEARRAVIREAASAESEGNSLKWIAPDAGLFAMGVLRTGPAEAPVESLVQQLRLEDGIRVLGGRAFGAPSAIRLALTAEPDRLAKAVEVIERRARRLSRSSE